MKFKTKRTSAQRAIKCVLWDFGDTLVDQRFMLKNPDGLPRWSSVWSEVMGELSDSWYSGEISSEEVSFAISKKLAAPGFNVLAHMKDTCRSISFFERSYSVAKDFALASAIVTINPDNFSEIIDPYYGLNLHFDAIVTSWQERSLNKVLLCKRALERIGPTFSPSETLLIDNLSDNIKAWESLGGKGYLFRGESEFQADIASDNSVVSLFRSHLRL